MRRILVLRGGALGDLIVTLPALHALRQKWPVAQIDFVGNATAAALAQNAGLVDHVESQHAAPWQQLYGGELSVSFRERLMEYDLVLSFWPDADRDLARHFPLHDSQRYVSAAATSRTTPAARHFNAVVSNLTGFAIPDWLPLQEPRPQSALIAIHPGSGSAQKNWPIERWLKIAAWLRDEAKLNPVFILGEAEEAIHSLPAFETWRNLPLDALALRLSHCRFYLGHDTGISHLAGACCQCGLLLFGPTDPDIWAPPNPNFCVIRTGDTLDAIAVDQVMRQLVAMLADRT